MKTCRSFNNFDQGGPEWLFCSPPTIFLSSFFTPIIMPSAGKIVKHLIAKHGPLTTNSLATHVSTFEKQLVSKSHMKHHILASLEGQGVLYKKVHRDAATLKSSWRWEFTNEADAALYREIK